MRTPRRPRAARPAGVLLALGLAVGPALAGCTATEQSPESPTGSSSGQTSAAGTTGATAGEVLRLLAEVRVVPRRPFPGGYDRDCGPGDGCVFGSAWTDDTSAPQGHNGCDTRNDVLRAQLAGPVVAPGTHGCKVVGGTLHDPYTGRSFDFTVHHQMIQVDHLVPLAYAWDMGASRWSQSRRERFANDTAVELLAVWGPANMSKGDSGPGDWLPLNRAFRCPYLARYLRAVRAYDLSITGSDAASIRYTARGCDGGRS